MSDAVRDDAFRAFLAALEASMAGDESIERLAISVHLSRSQLDRVIAAVAGESPAALRRRLLLERAAFVLLTSGATVLDVALGAGFSSHAGFTRAFTRAYGRAPDRFRRDASVIALPSPTGVHFQPPDGLRLPATGRTTSMDVTIGMLDHHIWLTGELIDRAAELPGDVLDETVPGADFIDDAPPIRSLLSRITGQLHMWNDVIAGRTYDFAVERDEPIDAMRRRWTEQSAAFAADIAAVVAQQRLGDTFVFIERDGPKVYTYGGLLAHVLTFGIHRRVEVLGALSRHQATGLDYGDPREWIPQHQSAPNASSPP